MQFPLQEPSSILLGLHQTGIFVKPFVILVGLIVLVALPVSAQDVQWKLVDTGVLTHSSHGKGIEMRIQPDPVPKGLFGSDNLDDLILALCNHYAPSVIPFVQQQADIEDPDFISVRLISGGAFGRYVLARYAISDGQCVDLR
ncbi:hypothetical protein J7376_02555 [Paracoccus sp. R12_1]|uniref:hypothetical protein n=1 Tax=unclassified Paracoccus (in: a-proteobacteria) TaxID=2688777 RepID=UPI001ADC83C6|nr:MULTISPECIES: hypothetical protein [unclassified Paracoccus (in: a-proteobacteria)]MBO9454924.1 hypothetical protein [Paracoccus sp. R12_2]MBO9485388.1 hypothetical protein [Paracoccus sp. R12_1]